MSTTEKRKATQIRFEGPDADVDRVSGDEIPQRYVFAAALAGRMADDRRLPLEIEAMPA